MPWFNIFNLVYFILSSFAWPSAYIPDIAITCFGVLVYVVYFFYYNVEIKLNRVTFCIIGAFLLYFSYNVFLGAYTISLKYVPPLLLCFLSKEVKYNLLQFVTKWYSVLMCVSVLVYIVTFLIDIPKIGVINNYIYDPFENYILYLKPIKILEIFRFNSFYFEPGHCAVVGSMLLFANRYSLRTNYYLIPILVSILLSLSLAGYLLLLLGVVIQNLNKFKTIFVAFCIVLSFVFFVVFVWNEGDNPVNELIVARLELDEKGGIKGNNRVYMDTNRSLDDAVSKRDIWTGIGIERFNSLFNHSIAGSGYKIFLLQYGIIGILLLSLIYLSYSLTATKINRHFANLFLIFIALTFMQRTYTFWFSWQLPFICSIVITKAMEINKRAECKARIFMSQQKN